MSTLIAIKEYNIKDVINRGKHLYVVIIPMKEDGIEGVKWQAYPLFSRWWKNTLRTNGWFEASKPI